MKMLLIFLIAILVSVSTYGFDNEPHLLVLPGHTNSLSAGPNGEVLVTCDYKALDGRVPRPGEPCTGEPTLAISVEDLRNLRYISQARDNNELVQRVYEKYDDIVFIVSPDFEVPLNSYYSQDVSPITVRHPSVPEEIYSAYASRARDVLRARGPNGAGYVLGVTIGSYGYDPAINGIGNINPLQNKWRPLADFTLVFLPANPGKSTIIHELMHYLIDSSREDSVVSIRRLEEFRKNNGFGTYLEEHVLKDSSLVELEEDQLAAYELSRIITLLDNLDDTTPEEIEVNYFISKYRNDLGLIEAADDHRGSFWHFSDYYLEEVRLLSLIRDDRLALPFNVQRHIRENLPFKIGTQIRQNYFRNVWSNIKTIAEAYPRGLLGDENNPQPGTMMYQFIKDIGTRAQTSP
jgi:hypothetical protein